MKIKNNIELSKISSIGIGGTAKVIYYPETLDDAKLLFKKFGRNIGIIGSGTNIVFEDGLHTRPYLSTVELDGLDERENELFLECGYNSSKLVELSIDKEISGFIPLYGIPGTIGGAISGNASATANSIFDIIKSVETINPDGSMNIENEFTPTYRNGNIRNFIYGITFKKIKGRKEQLLKEKYLIVEKRKNQPSGRTCGSVFKNPENNYAGILIEKAGLKGYRICDLEISKVHGNFFINNGKANYNDFIEMINIVRNRVLKLFGIELLLEIKVFKR
jgi:UDP-N-acetylmuramate dehydrogenase